MDVLLLLLYTHLQDKKTTAFKFSASRQVSRAVRALCARTAKQLARAQQQKSGGEHFACKRGEKQQHSRREKAIFAGELNDEGKYGISRDKRGGHRSRGADPLHFLFRIPPDGRAENHLSG